jgi:hypothetical protein
MLLPPRRGSSLPHSYSLSPDGFTSFHLPSGVLFSFHSRYYYAIGFWECLGLGVHAPHLPAEFPIRRTLCSGITLVDSITGLSPSTVPRSRGLHASTVGWTRAPHLHAVSRTDSACPVPFSIAFTNGIHNCFLFLCLLRCFNSAGYLSQREWPCGQEVPFGHLRFIGSLRLPGVISRLGTTFFGSRTERSPIWFVATRLKSLDSIDFGTSA